MLTSLDLDLTLNEQEHEQRLEELMLQLRELQRSCFEHKQAMVILLEGWALAGKGSLVAKLVDHMDPRGFSVHSIWPATEEERVRPFLHRFWQKLPPAGHIAIFYHSWYTHVLEDRQFKRIPKTSVAEYFRYINGFERLLTDEGIPVAKFWVHLSRKELKKRLKARAKDKLTAWRVRPEDLHQAENYKKYVGLAEDMLAQTSTAAAPWTLVEGNCPRWSQVKVLESIVFRLSQTLSPPELAAEPPSPLSVELAVELAVEQGVPDLLARVDLSLELDKDDYQPLLETLQQRMLKIQRRIDKHNLPVLIMFEGWDAAGKGGAIQRLTTVLDPRGFRVTGYSAPSAEEKSYPYLWRFWRKLPDPGQIGIFDRTWYGRVLVERVEGFADEPDWRRAYTEINDLESQLAHAGFVLVKFWLHIDSDEQLRRFNDRQEDPFKVHKITDDDWRNRNQRDAYYAAVNEMLMRTDTAHAPWTLVAANDKYHARVKVVETVVEVLEGRFKKGK